MIEKFTQVEYDNASNKSLLPLECYLCQKMFLKRKSAIRLAKIGYVNKEVSHLARNRYCSRTCYYKAKSNKQAVQCQLCHKIFSLNPSKISHHNFCNKSCAASYNNTHKKKGVRRSKLEVWLEKELRHTYDFDMHFCRKDTINSELDIYIPSLKLAFELNGIFHYEPIYGADKLCQIQNNDHRKFQACLEQGIELCIIDVSKMKYAKLPAMQTYLDIIHSIIQLRRRTISTIE